MSKKVQKKLNKQQIEVLKNDIAIKERMTRKIGNWWKFSFIFGALFVAVASVGFSGFNDKYFPFEGSVATFVCWASVILSILCIVFGILTFISWRHSKRHVLYLIDLFEKQ